MCVCARVCVSDVTETNTAELLSSNSGNQVNPPSTTAAEQIVYDYIDPNAIYSSPYRGTPLYEVNAPTSLDTELTVDDSYVEVNDEEYQTLSQDDIVKSNYVAVKPALNAPMKRVANEPCTRLKSMRREGDNEGTYECASFNVNRRIMS